MLSGGTTAVAGGLGLVGAAGMGVAAATVGGPTAMLAGGLTTYQGNKSRLQAQKQRNDLKAIDMGPGADDPRLTSTSDTSASPALQEFRQYAMSRADSKAQRGAIKTAGAGFSRQRPQPLDTRRPLSKDRFGGCGRRRGASAVPLQVLQP